MALSDSTLNLLGEIERKGEVLLDEAGRVNDDLKALVEKLKALPFKREYDVSFGPHMLAWQPGDDGHWDLFVIHRDMDPVPVISAAIEFRVWSHAKIDRFVLGLAREYQVNLYDPL